MKASTPWTLLLLLLLLCGCGSGAKMRRVKQQELSARLSLSQEEWEEERSIIRSGTRDTLTLRDGDREIIVMKAIRDEETGEMVANEVIDAAVVTARFRNIAERLGQIDIRFDVCVPAAMQDAKWQLRLYPQLFVQADTLPLQAVIVTGADYRKEQLRGYRQYERYLRSIITDSTRFVDWRNLKIWIDRNLSHNFGPDGQEALLHYTRKMLKRYHKSKWDAREKVFAHYVPSPILTEGVRLDTVLQDAGGDFVYEYTQTLRTRPRLKKVEVVLSGEIFQEERHLYSMPRTQPLAFYVSSLSDLTDPTERYVTRIVERRASSHNSCELAFRPGQWEMDPNLEDNRYQMDRIRENILELERNDEYVTDSVVVSAWASPEGSLAANQLLTQRRAASVAGYFQRFLQHYRDSVQSFRITVTEDGRERLTAAEKPAPIRFLSHSKGENWTLLERLVLLDSCLTSAQKASFLSVSGRPEDQREEALRKEAFYPYLREQLYPRLRLVSFDFYLSRKGMVKDTVHTTEPDTLYRRAVALLRDRDYPAALELLRPYRDVNTALACMALDYNASALDILLQQKRTPAVNYLLALLYARRQEDELAVQHFLDACRENRSLLFRGNLDPEIHVLIERYGLDRDDETDINY